MVALAVASIAMLGMLLYSLKASSALKDKRSLAGP